MPTKTTTHTILVVSLLMGSVLLVASSASAIHVCSPPAISQSDMGQLKFQCVAVNNSNGDVCIAIWIGKWRDGSWEDPEDDLIFMDCVTTKELNP